MLSRRILLLTGGTVALSAVFGVVGPFGETVEVDAADSDRDGRFTYRGRSVRVRESRNMVMVDIGGRGELHIERPAANRYYSHLAPFQEFSSSRQVITTLIDMEDDRLLVL